MSSIMNHESFVKTISGLGICGCGSPEEAYEAIHKLLLSLPTRPNSTKNWDEWTNTIDSDIYALILVYFLDDKGYLEHGTSICHPWLTSKGIQLIAAMDILKSHEYDFGEAENSI